MNKPHFITFILIVLIAIAYFVFSNEISVYMLGLALVANELLLSSYEYKKEKSKISIIEIIALIIVSIGLILLLIGSF